jgi:hypothetical protein
MSKPRAQRAQVDLLRGVEINRPFPMLPLTDFQWREVCKLSGISEDADKARKSIEIALGMFRQFENDELRNRGAADIREELRRLAQDLKQLYERFAQLIESREAYLALTAEPEPLTSPARTAVIGVHQESSAGPEQHETVDDSDARVSQTCDILLRAPKWLLTAANQIKAEKRGPKAANAYWLVGNLDGIREQFTGKKITRSYKDPSSSEYVNYLCKIADPSVGPGTIQQAMRARIGQRNKLKKSRG